MVAREVKFDDMDDTPGAERIEITIDGRSWALYLAKANRQRFDRAPEPFLSAAHPSVGTSSRRRMVRRRCSRLVRLHPILAGWAADLRA